MSTDRPQRRILLTGLPSTGKTTLAVLVAQALEIEPIREAASDVSRAGSTVDPSTSWPTIAAISLLQQAREAAHLEFVADRGAVDVLAYTLSASGQTKTPMGQLLAPALWTTALEWARRADYSLVVFHRHLLGKRGEEIRRSELGHIRDLEAAFAAVLDELGLPTIEPPADTSPSERLELVRTAIESVKLLTEDL